MEIRITTGKYSHDQAEMIYVPFSRRCQVSASDNVVIARRTSASWNFSDDVPEGYTCINYKDARLEDVIHQTELFNQGTSQVICWNMATTGDVVATGTDPQHPQYNYYTVRATLICVRSDLIVTE